MPGRIPTRTPSGQPAGYIVDLCREVAAALGPGVRTEYVLVHAGERFQAVQDGKVDILCDPSSVTIARREIVDFSLPTFLDGAGVLSRQSKPVQRFEDLAGKRVGVLVGTTTEQVLRDSLQALGITANVVAVRDHRNGMQLVEDDKLDAYFADRGILAAMLREGGRPGFELSKQYFSYETYALALPRDDSAFRLLVDKTLARALSNGQDQRHPGQDLRPRAARRHAQGHVRDQFAAGKVNVKSAERRKPRIARRPQQRAR